MFCHNDSVFSRDSSSFFSFPFICSVPCLLLVKILTTWYSIVQDLAFDLSLAALLGDNIYNFGELLAHPIVSNSLLVLDFLF
jgi:hypothetical protein